MPASMRSMQFGTARHARLSVGVGGDDDDYADTDQMGASNPVHQGVSEVTPWMADTAGTVAATTAWKSRKSAGSLPQPYTARNAGSVFKFNQ